MKARITSGLSPRCMQVQTVHVAFELGRTVVAARGFEFDPHQIIARSFSASNAGGTTAGGGGGGGAAAGLSAGGGSG